LFIVPSLRSRRPKGPEKKALDIAFLGTPLLSILAPIATKDTGLIWLGKYCCNIYSFCFRFALRVANRCRFLFPWTANFVVVAGSYGYAFVLDDDEGGDDDEKNQPAWLKFVYKSLDFGGGRERGSRK
jgi:hypothetical protein